MSRRTKLKATSKRFVFKLRFVLDEEVTPLLFARRVADACGKYGAMREGELVLTIDDDVGWKIGSLSKAKS